MTPQTAARRLEKRRHIAGGHVERLAGYGLLGVAFEAGHAVAIMRSTASSIGPPYASIWVRDPQARWTIHTSVEPSRSCPRYFGPALDDVRVEEIEVGWRNEYEIVVTARKSRIYAALRLKATPLMHALGAASRSMPERVWRRERQQPLLGRIAGRLLDAGPLELAGHTPSGHAYLLRPHRVWRVAAAVCMVEGRDLGSLAAPVEQPRIGDLGLPRRAVLAAGTVTFERQP
jgi:hypothetical protein